jgi:thioredoxin 1
MAELPDVTDTNFDEQVLQSPIPVIVDFWGEHCPPCRVIAPILADCASEYAGRVKIVQLNSDENGETMVRYHVMALPTVLAFVRGEVVSQLNGARPKKDFVAMIEAALGG